jgi:hypothetical protein
LNCFKHCTVCGAEWASRDAFLADPAVTLVGYQVNFIDLCAGLFLFDHSCGTTLAIPAAAFADLHKGPICTTRIAGTDECPGYCLRREELGLCPARCECAFVRDILHMIRNWGDKELRAPAAG